MPNYWNPNNMYQATYPQYQVPMMPQQIQQVANSIPRF